MNDRLPRRNRSRSRNSAPERTCAESGFERPFVSVDVAILALRDHRLQVLLLKRGTEPFRGAWALPGGSIHPQEDADLEVAARRILREKAEVETPYVEQLQGFGSARRDPRGWSATFAYFALIAADGLVLQPRNSTEDVAWWEIEGRRVCTALAFDHADILACAVTRLRNKVEYTSLPVHLLPEKFTLPDLQRIYEQILDRRMDKSAFRKRIAEANFLEAIPGEKRAASNRPAQMAFQELEVDRNRSDLQLRLGPMPVVHFAFVDFEGSAANAAGAQVLAKRVELWGEGKPEYLALNDGAATMMPGHWVFSLAPNSSWYVARYEAPPVIVPGEAKVKFVLSLNPGSIRGAVSGASAGAPVFLERNGEVRTVRADLNGKFQFAGLAPGTYRLYSSFAGEDAAAVQVAVAEGAAVVQDLVLR